MYEERIISDDGHYIARLMLDEWPENPREMWDHETTIVYSCDSRYVLGDEAVDPDDFVMPDNVWAFPVYAHIHSGVRLSMSDPQDGWDSGQSGYIYISKDRVPDEARAYEICRADIAEFSAFLGEDVWGYALYRVPEGEDPDMVSYGACEELNVCFGFYGYDAVQRVIRDLFEEEMAA